MAALRKWVTGLWAKLFPAKGMAAKAKVQTTVSVRVFRADGTVEDLGIISRDGRPVRR